MRVFDAAPVVDDCSCSEAKVHAVLDSFTADEIAESIEDDGRIHVTCEFCSTDYVFDPSEFSGK